MPFSRGLHVLGAPPAFVLSQDQTLQLKCVCLKADACRFTRLENNFPHGRTLKTACVRAGLCGATHTDLAPRPMRLGDLSGPAHPNLPRRDCPVSWTHQSQLTRLHIDPLRQSTIAIRKEDAALYPGSYWSNVSDSPNWPSPPLDGICQRTSADIVPSADAGLYGQRTSCQADCSTWLARPGRPAPCWTALSRPARNAYCMRTARPVKDISEMGRKAHISSGPAPGRRPALGGRHIVRTPPGLSSRMPGCLPGDSTRPRRW